MKNHHCTFCVRIFGDLWKAMNSYGFWFQTHNNLELPRLLFTSKIQSTSLYSQSFPSKNTVLTYSIEFWVSNILFVEEHDNQNYQKSSFCEHTDTRKIPTLPASLPQQKSQSSVFCFIYKYMFQTFNNFRIAIAQLKASEASSETQSGKIRGIFFLLILKTFLLSSKFLHLFDGFS